MFGNPEEKFMKRSNLQKQADWEKRAIQQVINREKLLNDSNSGSDDSFT
jgi:hypothetical protein